MSSTSSPLPLKASGRIEWLDVAKGLGIFAVVVGHVADTSIHPFMKPLMWFLFLFHMPLFFILSGYVFKPKADREFIMAKVQSLLIPYFVYLTGIFIVLHAKDLLHIHHEFQPLVDDMGKALYGGRMLTVSLGVFWFITCLFFTQIIYNFMFRRISSPTVLWGIISVLAVLGLLIGKFMNDFTLPWALTVVPVALACFAFGDYLRGAKPSDTMLTTASIYIILVSLGCLYFGVQFALNLKYSVYGPIVLGLLLSFALSWLVILLSKATEKFRYPTLVLGELGRASLVIMFLHQFIHFNSRKLGVHSDTVIIMAAIIIPYIAYLIFKKNHYTRMLFLGQR